MNQLDEDEIEAMTWEVETISKQIKDIVEGRVDVNKLVEQERAIRERKEKEEKIRKMKEEEEIRKEHERQVNGRKGHGDGDKYEKFCIKCQVEYELKEMNLCTHCRRELMTMEDRHKDLKAKIEKLKEQKAKKKFRRMKYENWRKFEQMAKISADKKGPTDYEKWELYESESDEESKEPVLPRHNPEFIALEKQMNDDLKERELSRKKANQLKDEGNQMMNECKFKKAVKLYTQAIEITRSMMPLYTNRALAYIKLDDYEKALNDCDRVIEYLDVFQDEIIRNKEVFIKALSRKALACLKLKNYEDAKGSVDKAIEYKPDDGDLKKLQEVILTEEGIHNKKLELLKGNGELKEFGVIKAFIEDMRKDDDIKSETLRKNLNDIEGILQSSENFRLYFEQCGGLEIIFTNLLNYHQLLSLISILSKDKKFQILINNVKGYNNLINILFGKQQQNVANSCLTTSQCSCIMEILEEASLNEEVRKNLTGIKKLDEMIDAGMTKFDIGKESIINDQEAANLIIHLYTFISNVCYSSPQVRSKIVALSKLLLEQIRNFIKIFNCDQIIQVNLLESVVSFLINLSCDLSFRQELAKEKDFLKFLSTNLLIQLIKEEAQFTKIEDLYEKTLSLFYNLSFLGESFDHEQIKYYVEIKIDQFLKYFILNIPNDSFTSGTLISLLRTLMLILRFVKLDYQVFDNQDGFFSKIINVTSRKILLLNQSIVENGIKILAHLLQRNNIHNEIKIENFVELATNLTEILIEDYNADVIKNEERIINTMSVMISLVGKISNIAEHLKAVVPGVIEIAKERTGLLRKNSAILLAKLAKSSGEMENYVRERHGMEVLLNIAKFINIK